MHLDEQFYQKETRMGYEISEKMKKVWAVELNLLEYFDTLCREHNLQYFAAYGTLLGTVRHQGFIPWDDDIDVFMFRNEYEKLKSVAQDSISEPYFFQNSYTDTMISAFSKIRDSRTTAIEFPDISPEFNQGIFIDIFPLDDAPDDINMKPVINQMQREIWMSVVNPQGLKKILDNGYRPALEAGILLELTGMQIRERMKIFEDFNVSQFGKSEKVCFITSHFLTSRSVLRKWFSDTLYLPFENMVIPVPVGYDELLKCRYKDYMTPVRNHQSLHSGVFFDPDAPYTKYMYK